MKITIFILTLCFLSISVQANEEYLNTKDPFESYNRDVFKFNKEFNNLIGEPLANIYLDNVPKPIQTGFDNFFGNLNEPLNMINSLLQGDIEKSLRTLMRFSINSVFGIFGLLDIATPSGLRHQKEDLGQTLYVWGVWRESSFIVLPILGPYTTRGLVGNTISSLYSPTYQHILKVDDKGQVLIFLGGRFVEYTKVINLMDKIEQQADPYIFMRESYLQYRKNLIYNGNPPQSKLLDNFDFD